MSNSGVGCILAVMTQTAMFFTEPVNPVAREEVATNVLLVEWLVKLEQQLSVKQRLIEEQQQQIEAQQKQIEQLKEELHKLKNRSSKNSERPPFIRPAQKAQRQK